MKYRIKKSIGYGFYVEVKNHWFDSYSKLCSFIPYPVTSYFETILEAEEAAEDYKYTKENNNKIVKTGEIK